MTTSVDAVFEGGAFHPQGCDGLPLADGTRVRLTVETLDVPDAANALELAGDVYKGLSEEDVRQIESIACDRSRFFSE